MNGPMNQMGEWTSGTLHGGGGYVEMTCDGVQRPFSMPKPKLPKLGKRTKGVEHDL